MFILSNKTVKPPLLRGEYQLKEYHRKDKNVK